MERGNTQHGQHVDDEMAAETRDLKAGTSSRSAYWRDAEPPVEDEPGGDQASLPPRGSSPLGMTSSDVEGRFELARYLDTSRFPATAEEIREMAGQAHAPDSVMNELTRLPSRRYESVTKAWEALGHGVESSRPDTD